MIPKSAPAAGPRAAHDPDSDGRPVSDDTVQFDWISLVKWNAEAYHLDAPDVFVAGDHLIYPVKDRPDIRLAPDVSVAFGRPKRDRGSYKVWEEANVFPQVLFEVWSPANRQQQMEDKRAAYDQYGAEEYYILYPEFPAYAEGWRRGPAALERVPDMDGFVSPRLGFRFAVAAGDMTLFGPDGRELLTPAGIARQRDAAEARAERLAARLRALGADPDAG